MAGPTGVNARTSDGVFPSLGSIQSASYLKAGSVVKNYQDKLDYFISETDEGSNIPIAGTTPQLYANPEVTTPGTGETNTASNIGVGEGPFAQKVASDLQFNSESYGYGIESQLLDNTYYRGLNPFIADQISAFSGDMITTRSTPTTTINRSGVLEQVMADRASYGDQGLSCFGSFTNDLTYSQSFSDASWEVVGTATKVSTSELSPELTNDAVLVSNSDNVNNRIEKAVAPGVVSGNPQYSHIFVKGTKGESVFVKAQFPGSSTMLVTLTGGWQKVRFNDTPTATATMFFRIYGNTATSFYLWGGFTTESVFSELPHVKTESTVTVVASELSILQGLGNIPNFGGSFCFVLDAAIPDKGVESPVIHAGDNLDLYFNRENGGDLKFIINGASSAVVATGINEEIHRYVLRFDGSSIALFVDGSQVGSSELVENSMIDFTKDIKLGSDYSETKSMNSYLKIKRWLVNESLTDAQILEIGGPDNVIL